VSLADVLARKFELPLAQKPRGVDRYASWRGYGWGLVAVAASNVFLGAVFHYLRLSDLLLISILSVAAISARFPLGPSLFTALITAVSFDYFFIPPMFALLTTEPRHLITLAVFSVVAAIISGLGDRARQAHNAARAREVQIESERLRNSLLSAVSHDMRTPLASILGAGTALLQDGSELDSETRRGLSESIVLEAVRLDQLVANLLDFARLDGRVIDLRKRAEPVEEIVEASLGRLRGRLGDRVVHSRVPEEIPMVPMDHVLMQQVLVNLLENALRYTSERSPLEIEASREANLVAIEVRDRGPGIRDDEAERLFERFYRGSASTTRDGGVGLGLTVCRAIVDAHGGTITLRNRDGGGAVARVTLPLSEGALS
jgi:two-component system sensor histidine kinase KdpD